VAIDQRIVAFRRALPDHAAAGQRLLTARRAHAPYRVDQDVRTWPRFETLNVDGNAIHKKAVVVQDAMHVDRVQLARHQGRQRAANFIADRRGPAIVLEYVAPGRACLND